MITTLLIIANAVMVQFIDLSSFLPNPTLEVAAGWEAEEIARIRFEDYLTPSSSGDFRIHGCLVDLNIEEEPEWQCIIGGENAIVMLNSEGVYNNFPISIQGYRLIPEYSDDYILVRSQNPHHMDCSGRKPYANLIDTGNGSERTVVSERNGVTLSGSAGHFVSLLGPKGTVYFSDYAGTVGVNSPEHGQSIYNPAIRSNCLLISDYSMSKDGELYATVYPGRIVGMNPEGFSWENATANSRLIDVSDDGEIVVADDQRDGVIVLDGNTGQIIERYLRNEQIISLQLSSNGNFIGAVVLDSHRTLESSRILRIVLIDRNVNREILLDQLDTSNFGDLMGLHQITDDGLILLEDLYNDSDGSTKLHLISSDGKIIWTSENINGGGRLTNHELTIMATTIASVDQEGHELLVSYYNNALQELIVIELSEV